MSVEQLLKLKLSRGQLVLIHLLSGTTICGAYLGNYNETEFDFENHRNGSVEKIKLSEIESLVI